MDRKPAKPSALSAPSPVKEAALRLPRPALPRLPTLPTGAMVKAKEAVTIPPLQRVAVGVTAGCLGHSICFPIDTVKTRLQASQGRLTISQAVRDVAQGGPRNFYRGLLASLVGVGPEKAAKLVTNDMVRKRLAPHGNITMGQQILAGSAAGVVQAFIATPGEYVKARKQMMELEVSRGLPRRTTFQIVSEGGLGLWRGIGATLMRDMPYNMMFFPIFYTMTSYVGDSPAGLIASGGIAGAVSAYMGTPADTVKTRLQIRGGEKYKGIVDCATQLMRHEGPGAFFKGAINRAAVQMPMYAIIMAAFVLQKRYLLERQEEQAAASGRD